jgi:prepilin-type N-terminal cleavage/methylation domain-containing protein
METQKEMTLKRKGFTLIELSIVLVIIALVIGGVLVGRALIKSAETNRAIGDLDRINAAVNSFKIKYNCLPGDCTNSTSLFDSTVAGNGNGNGLIEWSNSESLYATYSLLAAQLIVKKTVAAGVPYFSANNDGFGYLYYQDLYSNFRRRGVTISWFGTGNYANSVTCNQVNTAALTPSDTQAIDIKIDDGLPKLGSFLAFDGKIEQVPDCPAQVTAPQNCVDPGGANTYQNSDTIGCRTVYYLRGN